MMQAELFTDTLIQLIRDAFPRETLVPESALASPLKFKRTRDGTLDEPGDSVRRIVR